MTSANRRLVEEFYEATGGEIAAKLNGGGGIDELGGVLAPHVAADFECVMVSPYEERVFPGLDGLAAAWRDWIQPYSEFSIEIDSIEDLGDALLILVRQRGVIARGQVAIEDGSGSVWRFRGAELARAEFYVDADQARAAAGVA